MSSFHKKLVRGAKEVMWGQIGKEIHFLFTIKETHFYVGVGSQKVYYFIQRKHRRHCLKFQMCINLNIKFLKICILPNQY